MPCSKRPFDSLAHAEKRLAQIASNPQTDKIPTRAYACPSCSTDARTRFHLTSMPPARDTRSARV